MGLLDTLFEKRKLTLTDASAWRALGLTNATQSGVSVTPNNALRYSAVYACVRVLAESVASLPLVTYQRRGEAKERATGFYLYRLLKDQPNPILSSFEFRELMQTHLLLWGNAYCEIELDRQGRVVALWPLRPDKVESVERNGNELTYYYRLPDGQLEQMPGFSIFHLRGLSSDGLMGLSPIAMSRQSIGLGLAAEEFGNRFFGNDARPGGVLTHPGTLGDEAYKNLAQSWESRFSGLSKSHRTAILEEGMTYQEIGIPPEDAQFLETRKFQVNEIARIYRVPPHMVGDLERATFSNIEHQSLDFVIHSLRPWLVRWEQAINLRLMSSLEQAVYFAEFLVDGLLRGDTESRYNAYAVGRQNGWLSANDIRKLENLNPIPDGDVYLVPLNMVPASMAGQAPAAEANSDQQRAVPNNKYDGIPPEKIKESRARRSGQRRHTLRGDVLPVYRDVMGRILRREANDVGNKTKLIESGGFTEWLTNFFEQHQAFVIDQVTPIATAYGKQVARVASEEVGAESPAANRFDGFMTAYLQTFAARHVARQQAQVERALENGTTPEDQQAAVEAVMELWRDGPRADGIAGDEATRVNNAVAIFAYVAAGVVRKQWLAFGDNCPYCNNLNGQTVGIEVNFLSANQAFSPEGSDRPLIPNYNIGHAPAHDGCDCMVVSA